VFVIPKRLAADLRDRLGLVRAIETGTYRGRSARILAGLFPQVVTIEVDGALVVAASRALAGLPNVTVVHGFSSVELARLVDPHTQTLYCLDSHFSGGVTGGGEAECPLMDELAAIAGGHPDDCVLIDDARLFLAPPPPPHSEEAWPRYRTIEDALLAANPRRRVIVAHDTIVAVPERAADLARAFAALRPPVVGPVMWKLRDRLLVRT